MSDAPRWKTKKEAAIYMGVSTRTVDRWVQMGLLQAYTLPGGTRRRFRTGDLDKLLHGPLFAGPDGADDDDDEGNPPAA